jgi:hypothetical protein
MPQLSGKERAALRAQSESLAKAKTLQRLQVGAQGITFNVLVSCYTVMAAAFKEKRTTAMNMGRHV